jgi:hypothetical protein
MREANEMNNSGYWDVKERPMRKGERNHKIKQQKE